MSRFTLTTAALLLALTGCADRAKHSVELYDAGDYAGAASAADHGLAAHPDDGALWQMRIRAALAQGDAAGVATAYEHYRKQRGGDDRELLRELATATLRQALSSPSAPLKIAAINAVEAAELEPLAELVAKQMESDNDRVSASAAIAILHAFPLDTQKVVDNALRSEDPEARRIALDGLGRKVGKYATADFETALADADPRVRAVAARWLGQIRDHNVGDALAKRLHTDKDDNARAAAGIALARIGGPASELAALAQVALADPAISVQIAGVELLGAAHDDAALLAVVEKADPVVGLQAAIAVRARHPDAARGALDRAVAAPAWTTRAGAANLAMSVVGPDAGLAAARALLADKHIGVRLAAARAIVHVAPADAIAVFAAALTSQAERYEAAGDLAEAGDPRGRDLLDRVLRDPRASADDHGRAVSALHDARAITAGLVAALADPSPVVRVAAAAALAPHRL